MTAHDRIAVETIFATSVTDVRETGKKVARAFDVIEELLRDHREALGREFGDHFFEDLAGRIVRGILVHGFTNDQAVERILEPMKPTIANTIRAALLENESVETNPAKPIARVESDESEATVDRGELVSTLNRYLTHMHSWNKSEFTDVLADAMLRFFGRKSS